MKSRGFLVCFLLATWLGGAALWRSVAASNLGAKQASSTTIDAFSTPWEISFFLAHWLLIGFAVSLALAIGFAAYGYGTHHYPEVFVLPTLLASWLVVAVWSYLTLTSGFRGAADVLTRDSSPQSGVAVAYALLILIACLIFTLIEVLIATALKKREGRQPAG